MLVLEHIKLKQTRFYREIAEEERQKGRLEGVLEGRKETDIAILTRQLRRKFGRHPELDQCLWNLPNMSLNAMHDLVDAQPGFSGPADLQASLTINKQNR